MLPSGFRADLSTMTAYAELLGEVERTLGRRGGGGLLKLRMATLKTARLGENNSFLKVLTYADDLTTIWRTISSTDLSFLAHIKERLRKAQIAGT